MTLVTGMLYHVIIPIAQLSYLIYKHEAMLGNKSLFVNTTERRPRVSISK